MTITNYTDLERTQAQRIKELEAQLDAIKKAVNTALSLLGPLAPECCGCAFEWGMAIHTLNKAMKE